MKSEYISILFIITLVLVMLCGCSTIYREPVVTVEDITIANLTPSEVQLDVTLNILNPNPFGIHIKMITCNVSYLKDNIQKPLTMLKKEDITIEKGMNTIILPVKIQNVNLIKAGLNLLVSREITINVSGVVSPSIWGFSPDIPFNQTKKIYLDQMVKGL